MTMDNAYFLLESAPVTLRRCPRCSDVPFRPFMRGQVHRSGVAMVAERFMAFRSRRQEQSWALICSRCKEIVAYEDDTGASLSSERLNETDLLRRHENGYIRIHTEDVLLVNRLIDKGLVQQWDSPDGSRGVYVTRRGFDVLAKSWRK